MAGESVEFVHAQGAKVEDTVTGFQGTVTGAFFYINGCKRYLLEAKVEEGKEHVKPEDLVFDEDRLVALEEEPAEVPQKPTGGPRRAPSRERRS